MPLHQQIEGRDDKRHARSEVICLPVMLVLQMADGRQHREDGFNHHARVPRAPLTDFQVSGIAGAAMEASIRQHHHLVSELGNQRSELAIADTHHVAVPGDKQADMIQNKAQLGPNNPAPIRNTLVAQRARTATFPTRVNQFDAIRVGDAQQTRFGQEIIRPRSMRRQGSKQPCTLRQAGKQWTIIARQPAIEGALPTAYSGPIKLDTESGRLKVYNYGHAQTLYRGLQGPSRT